MTTQTTARNAPLTTLDLLGKARWQAAKRLPYLAKGMWALTFVITDAVPTMAVDKHWRCYVNPKHIAECMAEGFDAVVTGVVHETLHPTLRHPERAEAIKAGDRHHANVCQDCELVQHIQAAGIKIFSHDVTPEMMGWERGLAWEEYYKLPRKKRDGAGKGGKLCSGGSGANGVAGPWELPQGGGQTKEGKSVPAGLSPAEIAIVQSAVAADIRAHVEQKGRGSVPAGLLRWAEEMIETPPIDWATLVPARVRYHIDTRRGPVASYARPSRRNAGGLVLPVHRNPRANVIVVGDTSGSMGDSDIGKIIGVVYEGIAALGTIRAIGCDAAATEPVECRHIEDLREALRGGGGTDMSLGIQVAAEHNPDVIVVVTDGDTGWPEAPPDAPVVVVLTRVSRYSTPPPWADVIDASEGT